jgi:hypothetical protein
MKDVFRRYAVLVHLVPDSLAGNSGRSFDGASHEFFKHGRCDALSFNVGQYGISHAHKTNGNLLVIHQPKKNDGNASLVGLFKVTHNRHLEKVACHQLNDTAHETALRHAFGHLAESHLWALRLAHKDNVLPVERGPHSKTEVGDVKAAAKTTHRLAQRHNVGALFFAHCVRHHLSNCLEAREMRCDRRKCKR